MTRRTRMLWIASLLLVALLALCAPPAYTILTGPVGTGESRTSPDGQYCASATSYNERRPFAAARNYHKYMLYPGACEPQPRGTPIWQASYEPAGGTTLDYGQRGAQYISWAAGGERVNFAIEGGRTLTIPVP